MSALQHPPPPIGSVATLCSDADTSIAAPGVSVTTTAPLSDLAVANPTAHAIATANNANARPLWRYIMRLTRWLAQMPGVRSSLRNRDMGYHTNACVVGPAQLSCNERVNCANSDQSDTTCRPHTSLRGRDAGNASLLVGTASFTVAWSSGLGWLWYCLDSVFDAVVEVVKSACLSR